MSLKNNRIACSDEIKTRFDKVGAELLITSANNKKFGHDEILDYLLKLHESKIKGQKQEVPSQ